MDLYRRINRSGKAVWAVLLLNFLMLFLLNHFSHYVGDDWVYMFSFSTGERMRSLEQIVPSMVAHTQGSNGRFLCHGIVQMFLMLPEGVFDLFNTAVYCAAVWMCYRFCRMGKEDNVLLLASAFMAFFYFLPAFGQQCLWLDGAINYLWAMFLCAAYLTPYVSHYRETEEKKRSAGQKTLFCIFAAAAGMYTEVASAVAIFLSVVLILSAGGKEKRKTWLWVPAVFAACGYGFMITRPAEIANKSADMNLAELLRNFSGITARMQKLFLVPIILWAVLMVYCTWQKGDRKTIKLSGIWMLGAMAGGYILTFASYYVDRCFGMTALMMIAAVGTLLGQDTVASEGTGRTEQMMLSFCAAALAVVFFGNAVTGSYDVWNTGIQYDCREEMIREQIEDGEEEVKIPLIYADTKYSIYKGTKDLDLQDSAAWPNAYMARVYGAGSIVGED